MLDAAWNEAALYPPAMRRVKEEGGTNVVAIYDILPLLHPPLFNMKVGGDFARWFDEAFASFFEALAIRQFNGAQAFQKEMEGSRKYFARYCEREPRGKTTPIVDYGKYEIGGFSYNKGAWSLYVLQQYLGEETFRQAISAFLHEYADKPANFDDFRRSVERSSGKDIGLWYQQWMLSGPESSDMLLQGKTVEEMVARCQSAPSTKRP